MGNIIVYGKRKYKERLSFSTVPIDPVKYLDSEINLFSRYRKECPIESIINEKHLLVLKFSTDVNIKEYSYIFSLIKKNNIHNVIFLIESENYRTFKFYNLSNYIDPNRVYFISKEDILYHVHGESVPLLLVVSSELKVINLLPISEVSINIINRYLLYNRMHYHLL